MKSFAIYYMNGFFYGDGVLGNFDKIDPKNLKKTHIYVKTIEIIDDGLGDMEFIFDMMNREQRPTPEQMLNLNLVHSSMSMGDILVDTGTNQVYVCSAFGWRELK